MRGGTGGDGEKKGSGEEREGKGRRREKCKWRGQTGRNIIF